MLHCKMKLGDVTCRQEASSLVDFRVAAVSLTVCQAVGAARWLCELPQAICSHHGRIPQHSTMAQKPQLACEPYRALGSALADDQWNSPSWCRSWWEGRHGWLPYGLCRQFKRVEHCMGPKTGIFCTVFKTLKFDARCATICSSHFSVCRCAVFLPLCSSPPLPSPPLPTCSSPHLPSSLCPSSLLPSGPHQPHL